MYSLPVASYWFDEDSHVDLTVQAMLAAIVEDLNKLATVGLLVDELAWRNLMYSSVFCFTQNCFLGWNPLLQISVSQGTVLPLHFLQRGFEVLEPVLESEAACGQRRGRIREVMANCRPFYSELGLLSNITTHAVTSVVAPLYRPYTPQRYL